MGEGDRSFYYAVGVTHVISGEVDFDDDDVEDDDQRWFNERIFVARGKRYATKGFVKDIYPYNVLNEHHLGVSIDGVGLADAIKANHWGALEKAGSSNWIWRIPLEKINEVRQAYSSHGLII
ncbi:hypothetical protein WJ977_21435 [Achromobacter xylosoxidans]